MKYATLLVSLLILIAVLIPGSDLPSVNIGGFDKIVHIGMFAVWAIAVRYDFSAPKFRYFIAFACGIVFSAATEVFQLLVEGRSFDLYDMAADAIGLIIGLLLSSAVLRAVNKLK
jgi:VanZ family protein